MRYVSRNCCSAAFLIYTTFKQYFMIYVVDIEPRRVKVLRAESYAIHPMHVVIKCIIYVSAKKKSDKR